MRLKTALAILLSQLSHWLGPSYKWNGTWHGSCPVVWLDEDAASVVVCGGARRHWGILQAKEQRGAVTHRTPGNSAHGTGVAHCGIQERLRQKEDVKYSLPMQAVDYVDVAARARDLGCRVPTRIALLPGNFATAASAAEFRYHEAAPEVRSAWRRIGLKDTGPYRKLRQKVAVTLETSGQQVPLSVFFGLGLVGNSKAVLLALGGVSSVLIVDPCSANAREIRFDAIVERPCSGGYTCLEYYGHACELIALAKPVREIWGGEPNANTTSHEVHTIA
jgi:hypothetical protein